ncbi:DUF1269 domain-containing protein [Thermodesulfobacteriota bacterium B35]
MSESNLIVGVFRDEGKAAAVLTDMKEREDFPLGELEDAAVVIKKKNGRIRLKQTKEITPGEGALGGSLVGLFTGIVTIINPLVVAIIGGVGGVLWGLFNDIGIEDRFMKSVGEHLVPGSSAIFVLAPSRLKETVVRELETFGATIFETDVPDKAHEELIRKSIDDWNRKQACEKAA